MHIARTEVAEAIGHPGRLRSSPGYRCPNTGDNVQAWTADDPEDDDLTYVQVRSLACAQVHLVNPKTGKVLGSEDE